MTARVARILIGLATVAGAAAALRPDVLAVGQAPAASLSAGKRDDLPASEGAARATLETSPRHSEYMNVMDRLLIPRTYIVHPPQGGRSALVLVIPDDRGLSDWARAIADQLAREGFTAIVPDLLTGAGPNGGGTASFASQDAVARALGQLPAEQVMQRLEGVWNYAMRLPGMTGKGAVVGFNWGGTYSFRFAGTEPEVGTMTGAVVFYGRPPEAAALAGVRVPVLGLYAGDDPGVTGTTDATAAEMKRLAKSYEPVVFAGAGHGFVRAQTERAANLTATEQAWSRAIAFLKERTK